MKFYYIQCFTLFLVSASYIDYKVEDFLNILLSMKFAA